MSHKINLGDEEFGKSLPSWIFDHLGGKSYISDEVTRSSLLLKKQTAHPEMDTSSLTKETNIMSQADLNKLREKYSFPSGVQLRIPGEGETILSVRKGEVAFYEAAFLASLGLPIHPTIRRILSHYKICPAQLSPNAWRSVVCSLVIWRYYKCHMSCNEYRYLYSLSPLPNSGWYYFKARPEKNLLRGSPSNMKGWKKRFFFASRDEWEFFPSMPASEGIPQVPSCNTLLALTEVEAKRMAEVLGKVEPGGYFDVLKVLGSWTFNKHFAIDRMEISTSVGDNAASGDKGEFQSNFQYGGSREDSVEYLGAIRGDVGRIARRAFPDIPDKTLLRWLGQKIQDSCTNLFPKRSNYCSDSRSESLSDSELPPELRFDAMSARIDPSAPIEKVGEKAATKDTGKATAHPPSKGVVIQEKHPREGEQVAKKGEVDSSKGKEVIPPPPLRGLNPTRGDQCRIAYWTGAIFPADKEKANQLSSEDLVSKSFHVLGQLSCSSLLSPLGVKSIKMTSTCRMPGRILLSLSWLEAEVAELTRNLVQAKELSIEEFKSSEDFKVAVTYSVATYFSEGFEFYKRQLLHQFPNLGIDVENMEMHASFAEEEEMTKEGEKEADNEGEAYPSMAFFNGDQGALSFSNEWAYCSRAISLMAIKMPCRRGVS
ncbi:hypothetical protein Acr_14g0001930 [Actinidia rufa]|uniref:Transposase (putative) gypsy type domain-containing protein n=1 Tax=Actinidia rufa TaxID=165716 RepID=A0A7J0FRL9_9ERIC|nr:hypothetical protein Acr_14g0001930 [Actinidia rufa]